MSEHVVEQHDPTPKGRRSRALIIALAAGAALVVAAGTVGAAQLIGHQQAAAEASALIAAHEDSIAAAQEATAQALQHEDDARDSVERIVSPVRAALDGAGGLVGEEPAAQLASYSAELEAALEAPGAGDAAIVGIDEAAATGTLWRGSEDEKADLRERFDEAERGNARIVEEGQARVTELGEFVDRLEPQLERIVADAVAASSAALAEREHSSPESTQRLDAAAAALAPTDVETASLGAELALERVAAIAEIATAYREHGESHQARVEELEREAEAAAQTERDRQATQQRSSSGGGSSSSGGGSSGDDDPWTDQNGNACTFIGATGLLMITPCIGR